MPKPLPIGTAYGRDVLLSKDRRDTHLHIMGASGQGKSKFIEHCIREDIAAGHGVCLIDPEGDLYDKIVKWCALHRVDRFRKIHLFDPTSSDWRFQFNPLFVHPGEKPRHRVDNVIEALAQVWGGEDSRNTPAIRTTLRAVFSVLIRHGYSLAEAFYLTSTKDPYSIVEQLTRELPNPILAEIWDGYLLSAENSPREHQTEFSGSRRRFGELLDDEEVREIFAAYDDPIDFRKCMDNNEIVLINLAPDAMGDDPARAFGALFVREMFYCASRRDVEYAEQNPFYAYIDECADFLTSDINKILARSRKRGLHVTLAHQWLEQLREHGDAIYRGVMSIQNKIIFGGIQDEDAVVMADELFRTEYDLEIPVGALIKPTVIDHERIWLKNWSIGSSESRSSSESSSWSESEIEGESGLEGTSISTDYDEWGFPSDSYTGIESETEGSVSSTTFTESHSSASSYSYTSTHTDGASEALSPVMEDRVSAVHSLENVRHMAVARLRNIPPQNAVVKGAATPSFDISTYFVKPVAVPDMMVTNFKRRVMDGSPYTLPAGEVRAVMQLRQDDLTSFQATLKSDAMDHEDILS